jgi:hypothetical protein
MNDYHATNLFVLTVSYYNNTAGIIYNNILTWLKLALKE